MQLDDNDTALGFSGEHHPNKNKNKISYDTGSVPDPKKVLPSTSKSTNTMTEITHHLYGT